MNIEKMYRITRIPSSISVADVILDTDAYNEIDDQYAIAYLLLSGKKLNTLGLTAAPFFNSLSTSPEDGMNKSYDEILHILSLMGREDLHAHVYRGSTCYLPDEKTPVESEAARYLVEEARRHTPDYPVYIIAIGAITNVASAILMDPEAMRNNTVIVWLGGHALSFSHTAEFNLRQDVAGARVLFNSGMNLTLVPCKGVVSELRTTEPELREWIKGQNALGDYLYDHTVEVAAKGNEGKPWSRVIWDVAAVAALLDRDTRKLVLSRMEYTPVLRDDLLYEEDRTRHPMRYVFYVNRDAIFADLFEKIRGMGKEETK